MCSSQAPEVLEALPRSVLVQQQSLQHLFGKDTERAVQEVEQQLLAAGKKALQLSRQDQVLFRCFPCKVWATRTESSTSCLRLRPLALRCRDVRGANCGALRSSAESSEYAD